MSEPLPDPHRTRILGSSHHYDFTNFGAPGMITIGKRAHTHARLNIIHSSVVVKMAQQTGFTDRDTEKDAKGRHTIGAVRYP